MPQQGPTSFMPSLPPSLQLQQMLPRWSTLRAFTLMTF